MTLPFSEENLEELTENYSIFHAAFFSERAHFDQQNEALLRLWTLVATTFGPVEDASRVGRCRNVFLEMLRVTQVQSVSPRFAEGVYRDAIRSKMTSALHIYSSLSLLKEFHYTVKLFDCPWRSNPVMEILEKKVPLSFPYLDYFSDECFLVCWRRLRVLLDNRAAELALNYVSFLVSVVFSGPDRCRASLRSWIRDVVESNNSALILVEVLVILMLHQEKDRESVDGALGPVPLPEVCGVGLRLGQRLKKSTGGSSKNVLVGVLVTDKAREAHGLVVDHILSRVSFNNTETLSESCLVAACWESQFVTREDEDFVTEKLAELVGRKIQTDAAHAIFYRFLKRSKSQEEFDVRMDLWVKLFSLQLDTLNFSLARQNESLAQNSEISLSRGFIFLSLLFETNKDFCHECLLTSISLNPQRATVTKLVDIAKERGLVEASFTIDAPVVKKSKETMNFDTSDFENVVENFIESLLKIQNRRTKQRAFAIKPMENLSKLRFGPFQVEKRAVTDLVSLIEACRWGILDSDQNWETLFSNIKKVLLDKSVRRPVFIPTVIDYNKIAENSVGPLPSVYGQIEPGFEYLGRKPYEAEEEKIVENGLSDADLADLTFNVKVQLPGHNVDGFEEQLSNDVIDAGQYFPRNHKKRKNFEPDFSSSAKRHFPSNKKTLGSLETNVIVGYCFVKSSYPVSPVKNDLSSLHPNSQEVRQILRTLVPGLENEKWQPPKSSVEYLVGVVHVTLGDSSDPQPSTSLTTTTATVTANTTQIPIAVLSNRKPEVTSADSTASATPRKEERETKIQYVYKHGTQTIVVDRQLTEEEISQIRIPSPNTRIATTSNGIQTITSSTFSGLSQTHIGPQIQHPQRLQVHLPSSHLSKEKGPAIILARPQGQLQGALSRVIIPAQTSSVDTLANTLISRIQTPVQLTPDGQPLRNDDKSSSSTGPPKFQFSFGRDILPSKSDNPELNGRKLILSPLQATQVTLAQPANIVQAKIGPGQQPAHVVLPLGANGLTPLQRAVLPTQLTLQNSPGPSASSSSDLIRQLNVARAQGLVVLQQWGDKQVLVHKATGRWIMRQGNKLVTVPPQILGISESGAVSATPSPSSSLGSSSTISMSSSTMEQIREFDSILESKFKSTPPPSEDVKPVVSTHQPQTFVILAPQGSVGSTAAMDFQQVKSFASISAPTSPSKVIKIPVSSISASASPISGATGMSSPFAKPPPKPQEDNDTLKRIQQILDDYNEQIRNAPDLQNRPAPRRRTNGPTILNSADSTKRTKRSSSVSPTPAASGSDSDVGSPSVVQISTPTLGDSNQSQASNGDSPPTTENPPNYSVVRQIVVPQSLAAQFQASGRQIMVVTGAGGKKMVAFKPVFVSASPSNIVNKVISVSAGGPANSVPTRILPTLLSTGSPLDSSTISIVKNETPISISSGNSSHSVSIQASTATIPVATPITSTTNFLANNSSSSIITLSTPPAGTRRSPSPPLGTIQIGMDERSMSPGLGLSEMTTEQLLDADLAASAFLDSNPESPFAMLSNSPTSSMIRQQDEDDLLNEALQENLFALDLPSSLLDEECGDLDLVNPHFGKRNRNLSNSSSDDIPPVSKRAKFIKVNSMDPNLMDSSQGVLRF